MYNSQSIFTEFNIIKIILFIGGKRIMSTMSQIKDRVFDLTKRLTETYPSRRAGDKGCIECAGEIEKS